ncbi:MAG: hypothetical protein ABIG60_02845 [Patescibacteria group bacterium]
MVLSGALVLAIFFSGLTGLIGIIIIDVFRRRILMKGIYAGDYHNPMPELKNKFLYSISGFEFGRTGLQLKDFLIGYIIGHDLSLGLAAGKTVFCEKTFLKEVEVGQIIIIKILKGINIGKLVAKKIKNKEEITHLEKEKINVEVIAQVAYIS